MKRFVLRRAVIVPAVLIFAIVALFVVGEIRVKNALDDMKKPTYEYFYTKIQCSEMERDISKHLEEMELFYSDYMSINISSGGNNHKTGEIDKNIIYVIVDGRLCSSEDEVVSIAEGFDVALQLYFGKSFEDWEYKFVSGDFVYENGYIGKCK